MKRKFIVSIIVEDDSKTLADGLQLARKTIEQLGLKVHDCKPIKDIRTLSQNRAMHKWFEMIASECKNKGVTMDMIVRKPAELPVTESLLKDLFRFIGKKMFGKDSTAKFEKNELNEIIPVFDRMITERTDINIPFPSENIDE